MLKNSMNLRLSVGMLLLAMFAVCFNTNVANAQSERQSANGHGTLLTQNPQGATVRRQFSFSARTANNGTSTGQAIVHNPAFSGDNGKKYTAKIDVKCLNVIGNVAIISGTVKRTNDPISSLAYFAVQDNGEPGGGGDAITTVFFFIEGGSQDPAQVCNELTVQDFTQSSAGNLFQPIESGNVQVTGGSATD